MADGRMLHKKISLNEAVASLDSDMHRLLFTWGISHLDIEGRISGSPKVFRAIVVPLLEHITSEKVSKFFKDAADKELIIRYQIGKEWFIQYPKFKDNQRLRADREAPSKIPSPPDLPLNTPGLLPEDAGSPPPLSLSKDKLSEEEDKISLIEDLSPEATPIPANNSKMTPDTLAILWNEKAPVELPKVNMPFRRAPKAMEKIRDALKRNPEKVWWSSVIERVHQSPFLRGEKGWKANIDFVIGKAEEILDGKYDGGGRVCTQPGIAAWLRESQTKEAEHGK